MGQMQASKFNPQPRTVEAELKYRADDGTQATEKVRVVYQGLSVRASRELSDDIDSLPHVLAQLVVELPDMLGEDDQPITPSVEVFDGMLLGNTVAIRDAIYEDINPPAQPPTS